MRVRSEVRARWRATFGVALVIGIAGAIVLAALAGASRTASAYPRFEAEQNGGQGGFASDPGHFFGFARIDFDKVERMPEIAQTARFAFFIAFVHTPSGYQLTPFGDRNPVVIFAPPDNAFGRVLDRMKTIEGHLPDPSRADEGAVSLDAATRYHIHVGDVLQVQLPGFKYFGSTTSTAIPTGPIVPVRVTGIEIAPGELGPGVGYPPFHFTKAFVERYTAASPSFPALAFKLRSDDDIARFLNRVQNEAIVDPGSSHRVELLSFLETKRAIQRTANIQATALRLLALLTALTALLILVQTITRQTYLESFDYTTLGALGLTRGELFAVAMVRTTIAAVVGAAAAVGIAFAASPLMPIGVSRIAEPSSGLSFDGPVLILGGIAVALVVIALGIAPALRASRIARKVQRDAPARTSKIAEAFSRSGLSPTSVAGVRMALETGRGRTAVPVRSTIIGTVVGVAAIATALTFAASIRHAVRTPQLQGVNWDATIGDDFDSDDAALVIPLLRGDKRVEEFSAGGAATLSIAGHGVTAVGMDQILGHIEPVLTEGRGAIREDEIVLGIRTLRELHRSVGDTVTVSSGQHSVRMTIVGRAVAPSIAAESFSGRGAFMTMQALRTLLPGNAEDVFLIRVRDRSTLPKVTARLRAALEGIAVRQGTVFGGDVDQLSHIRNLPLVLAGLLALLSVATLAHLIVTAIRTRRSQLAILKTLGFVRRQVRATVAWQATTIALVGLAVAVPVGYIVGRVTWGALANQMGFLSDPVIPAWQLLAVIPGLVLAANVVALVPGRRAARLAPAVALRSE